MANRVGQSLGNYRLLRLLGQGGFAEVYLGEHVYLETQAAIKVLLTQLAREDIEAFRIEARTIARLEHPHIVRVLDFGVEGGTPFLVMSYATGGTLRQHHPRGTRLSLPLVVSYVQQVASALQYAHEEKLIHRDVKPENILLGRHGEVLLSDFGIALMAQTSRHQLTQAPTGTVAYMAPEQIQGKPRSASDQYALGMVVYEWLSGILPFTGSVLEVFGQHLHVPPTPLHEKVSGIPIAVEQVVMRTLAKDPKDRFASMQAFATALEQASQVEDADEMIEGTRTRSASHQRTALSQREPPTEFVAQPGESVLPTALTLPPSVSPWPVVPDTPLDNQQIEPLPSPVASSSAWLASGDTPRPPSLETRPSVETATTPSAPPNLPTPDRAGTGSIHRSRARVFILCGVLALLILASAIGVAIVRSQTQPAGPSAGLYGVAWSGSRFVAVGTLGTILTSPDGSTWTAQSSGTSEWLLGVAWSGSRFIVVGWSSTILTSPDGSTWTATAQSPGILPAFSGVAWSSSRFVVVGGGGTILTSPDGSTWTVQSSGTSADLYGVAWLGSRFVAVGNDTILTSPDGSTWTVQSSGTSQALSKVAWSGSRFVAVGTSGAILTSP